MFFWNKKIYLKQKSVNSKKIVLVERNKILYIRWSSALTSIFLSILDEIGFREIGFIMRNTFYMRKNHVIDAK